MRIVSPWLLPLVLGAGIRLTAVPITPLARPLHPNVPVDTVDTLTTQLATITTDTGAFAPGHRDFSHYTTIELCTAAGLSTLFQHRMSLAAQMAEDSLLDDTVGLQAIASTVRSCGNRFTLATTAQSELPHLFELAVLEQDTALAEAVLNKQLTQTTLTQRRGDLLRTAMEIYLHMGWQTIAVQLTNQIDPHDPSMWAVRRDLRYDMMRFLYPEVEALHPVTTPWYQAFDELQRVLNERANPLDIASYTEEFWNWKLLMEVTEIEHPDSITAVARRAQHDILKYKDSAEKYHYNHWGRWDSQDIQVVIDTLSSDRQRNAEMLDGKMAPRLTADYWFTPPGQPMSDTVRPVPGKVNLMCSVGTLTNEDSPHSNFWDEQTFWQNTQIKRWLDEFGKAGLVVTLVRPTPGFVWKAYPNEGTNAQGFQNPADEAEFWRWYEHDYSKVPVTLAVQVMHSDWLPQPDGRRYRWGDFQLSAYLAPDDPLNPEFSTADCTLIGRTGRMLYTGGGRYWVQQKLLELFKDAR